ncbi:MAG: GAF domain-containing protein [Sandaracinaceae bacterium]|nr:GAF domain-containing protein [Sandaracinaceae bacterium]
MTALKLARAAVGESGGVPPGASCQVSPDGRVTIHDAVARKTYTLAPDTQSSLKPAAKPSAPQIPADRVPRPSSVPPPSQVMGAVDATKKAPQRTIAYDARELGLATAQAPAAPAASAPVPQTTIAYDAKEMGIAMAAAAAAPAATAAPEPAKKKKKKKLPAQTIAYDASQMGLAAAVPAPAPAKKAPQQTIAYDAKEMGLAPVAPAASPAPKKKAPAQTIAYDAKEMGLMAPEAPATALEPPAPEPPAPEPPPEEARMTQPDGVGGAPQTLVLMHSRDADPTAESPLCYRERIYFVPEVPSEYVLEALLSAQFEELRAELESRPKGKLVNLALFDHEWKGRPQGPPLLTLQWKDWRGEPVIQKPGQSAPPPAASTPPAAPVSTPPAAAAPAPSSPPPAEVWKSAPPPAQSAPPPAAPVSAPPPAQSAPPPPPPPARPRRPRSPRRRPPRPPGPAARAVRAAARRARLGPAVRAPPPAAPVSQPAPAASPAPSQPAPPRAAAPARAAATAEPQSDDRLVTAFEALQDLFFLTTPMEGVNFVMQLLDDLIPSEAKSVCLYDINADELRFVSLTGPGAEERQGEGVPRLSGLLGVAALSPNHTVLVEDASTDERFDPGVDGRLGLSVETLAVVALSHQGRLLGVLQLINRQEQMQYSRADGNLMHYIAEKLGEFLHAARLRPHPRA